MPDLGPPAGSSLRTSWFRISPIVFFAVLAGSVAVADLGYAQEPPGPDRFIIHTETAVGHAWRLLSWKDNEILCELLVDHTDLPTYQEVADGCGQALLDMWLTTPPCHEAASGGDASNCLGAYIVYVGYFEGERTVFEALPAPTVWITLEGCDSVGFTNHCSEAPILLLSATEPLPGEEILSVHVTIGETEFTCEGAECRVALPRQMPEGEPLEFWAESSYGDTSELFGGHIRAEIIRPSLGPSEDYWRVDVLSAQWAGGPLPACSLEWEAFTPFYDPPAWLVNPEQARELATDIPYNFLAGHLLQNGFVEASDCSWGGLFADGSANPCGLERARDAVRQWQNRFDEAIFETSLEARISPQLLKQLFAQESQFWPGDFPDAKEFGLGGLHPEGADVLLLYDFSLYSETCAAVLSEDACAKPYYELNASAQEMLRGAVINMIDATCPDCAGGIDLEKTGRSVDIFAQLMLANCQQTGWLIRAVTEEIPGTLASYEDLWRFTLVNYNAGAGCLTEALDQVWDDGFDLTWGAVQNALADLPACDAAAGYVDRITREPG